ncbi:unnamed protein product [Cyprideis torosa]|uniref:Cilia- and flagella-associated protein 206 n=1 Tax=Cyprideis torosa TaxID=163714 RepID=A0A7R8ZQS2_9CRUS|nr:unnamed protein product [Cyprideis torosa]CAG0902038.1 unnamed protein product [Cyprideis torosa]
MKFLGSVVISLSVCGIVCGITPWKDCGSPDGEIGSVSIFPDCGSSTSCILSRGTNVTLTVEFQSKVKSVSAKSVVHGILGGIPIPFPLSEPDACKSGSLDVCPVTAGKGLVYKENLPIKTIYPPVKVTVKWELKDDAGNDMICLLIPAKLQMSSGSLRNLLILTDDTAFSDIETYVEEHSQLLEDRLRPLKQSILRAPPSSDSMALTQKIVLYSIAITGLGSPLNRDTIRESFAVLESVLPQEEILTFASLAWSEEEQKGIFSGKRSDLTQRSCWRERGGESFDLPKASRHVGDDKEKILDDLVGTVAGIRLFNWKDEKSKHSAAKGIEDVPQSLQLALAAFNSALQKELGNIQSKAYQLTAVIEAHVLDPVAFPCPTKHEQFYEKVKLLVLSLRQAEVFFELLVKATHSLESNAEELLEIFDSKFTELKMTIDANDPVHSKVVYPLFIELWSSWSGIQSSLIALSVLTSFLSRFQQFVAIQEECVSSSMVTSLIPRLPGGVSTDSERAQEWEGHRIRRVPPPCSLLSYEEAQGMGSDFKIEYHSFCAWTLSWGEGLLVPGVATLGLVGYQGKFYAFSRPELAWDFACEPDRFLSSVQSLCVKNVIPGLEGFLYDELPRFTRKTSDSSQLSQGPPCLNASVQTGGHLPSTRVPQLKPSARSTKTNSKNTSSTISKSSWELKTLAEVNFSSQWILRKEAIKLLRISNSKTRSSQTLRSAFRASISTQTCNEDLRACVNTRLIQGQSSLDTPSGTEISRIVKCTRITSKSVASKDRACQTITTRAVQTE